MTATPGPARREAGLFVVLTLGVSTVFYVALARRGSLAGEGARWLILGGMWTPGLVALGLQLATRRTLRGLGWGWGGGRWWLLGYLAPILYAGVTYALIWASPLGDIRPGVFGRLAAQWRLVAVGALQGCAFALGEELGAGLALAGIAVALLVRFGPARALRASGASRG